MTRTAATKFVATALAVASLGMASTASAAEDQGFAAGEPTPGQPVPAQTPDQGGPQAEKKVPAEETAPGEKTQDQLDQDRFNRYCNMKDAEPSHSDKKFCEDFRNKHRGGTTSPNGNPDPGYEKPGYEHPRYEEPNYEKPNYEKPAPSYKKASEPSKGSLPFTGLEIWQLGLIGIVLAGGGIGARRLLVS
jgi:hypothetical protein